MYKMYPNYTVERCRIMPPSRLPRASGRDPPVLGVLRDPLYGPHRLLPIYINKNIISGGVLAGPGGGLIKIN